MVGRQYNSFEIMKIVDSGLEIKMICRKKTVLVSVPF